MSRSKPPMNPLGLAVLVLLDERPMHPYEIAATLRMRRKEQSIKLRYGSLYTVIDGLRAEGLIEARETARDGRRPERTTYAITAEGLGRMRARMRELLGAPVKEYPQFEAALSLLPALAPGEVTALLRDRARRLGETAEETRAALEVVSKVVEPLYLVENEYRLAMIEAERRFVEGLTRRIVEDEAYGRPWKQSHAARGPEGSRPDPASIEPPIPDPKEPGR